MTNDITIPRVRQLSAWRRAGVAVLAMAWAMEAIAIRIDVR